MSKARALAAKLPLLRRIWRLGKQNWHSISIRFRITGRHISRTETNLRLGRNVIVVENRRYGTNAWGIGGESRTRPADDIEMQVKGYASATSVNVGKSIGFHVSVGVEEDFSIAIYRLGHYSGAGARHLTTSPWLRGGRQAEPTIDPDSRLICCDWPSAWTLKVPRKWTSGYYMAVFTTRNGMRSFTPFVVTDRERRAALCVIIPFTTYQAYNQWPWDMVRGTNFYYGFDEAGQRTHSTRAFKISFDRPYARNGIPNRVDVDHYFLRWAEREGYDLTYATSIDLHDGTVDLSKYAGVVFSGHDEYWTKQMRKATADALAAGTNMAFLSANNIYWHVRIEDADAGKNRVIACYKGATDPDAGVSDGSARWRDSLPNPAEPEQILLGVQYNGIVPVPVPLVVRSADHWVWAGSGVKDGDEIPMIVGGEADGLFPDQPQPEGVKQTILSQSPYTEDGVDRMQNTSVYETENGAIMFAAGSLNWCWGLGHPQVADDRIRKATANVLNRLVQTKK